MGGKFFDVEYFHAVRFENAHGGEQREVRKMLVIDGVEFVPFHEPKQMRKLQRENSRGLQENPQAFHEIVEIGNLGKNVVAKNQVGAATFRNEFFRHLRAEEPHERGHAFIDGNLSDIGRRLNAKHRYLPADEILEQVTIVAGDFHDKALAIEAKSLGHFVAVAFAMLQPGIRIGGKIRVVGKNIFGPLVFFELHEEAFLTSVYMEGIVDFAILEIRGGRVGLAKGRHAKIDKSRSQGRTAETARLGGDPLLGMRDQVMEAIGMGLSSHKDLISRT